ncbi:hypothetical protein [Anaerosinus massiliensis]|uniref:hypothetical protein n=1 Tax=Massilibacillus massiliensis TaxID=1806837 RepID=UPI000DA609D2|nr:hypothetical protein [Massilibacillus massiliensis]
MRRFFENNHWLWNAAIVLVVSVLVFYFDPVGRAYEASDFRKDGGLKWIAIIVSIVTMMSTIFSLRHYWKWVIVAPFFVGTANQLHSTFIRFAGSYQNYTPMMHLREIILNDLIYVIFALPTTALVLFIRKKKQKGCDNNV